MAQAACVAWLAHVLRRCPVQRVRRNWRAGLVFRHARAISCRCVDHSHCGPATDNHAFADAAPNHNTVSHLDAAAYTHGNHFARAIGLHHAAAPDQHAAGHIYPPTVIPTFPSLTP